MPPPQLNDPTGWRTMILTHRRILLERLIAEFPEVLKTNRTKVNYWRLRLQTQPSEK